MISNMNMISQQKCDTHEQDCDIRKHVVDIKNQVSTTNLPPNTCLPHLEEGVATRTPSSGEKCIGRNPRCTHESSSAAYTMTSQEQKRMTPSR